MGTEHQMGKQPMMHPGAMSAVVEVMREMWGFLDDWGKEKCRREH
jgi:hypothetical protein